MPRLPRTAHAAARRAAHPGVAALALLTLATLTVAALATGCSKPTPPRYGLPPVAAEVGPAELPAQALDADLAALPTGQVGPSPEAR